MSSDNRIGANGVSAIIRAAAARRISSSGTEEKKALAASLASPISAESAPVARLIGMAQQVAEQGPPVDREKVASIKAAIADGRYSAIPATIASSMLQFYGKGD